MKVLHISHSDLGGGAARAAYRIHRAILEAGVYSRMLVDSRSSDDWTVEGPIGKGARASARIRSIFSAEFARSMAAINPAFHSAPLLPSKLVGRINQSDADIVHLHWIGGETLSIKDISRIRKPIIWTLHDMWAFCGAQHYADDLRWREGYRSDNRPPHESGVDVNKWVWTRKVDTWKKPFQIVCPSSWLARCVKESALMQNWPVRVIGNPLSRITWKPIDRQIARELLQLSPDRTIVAFGALGGGKDPRKGIDLLTAALDILGRERSDLELVVFGQSTPQAPSNIGLPIRYMGHMHDELSLRAIYSAADVVVVPSKQEAFGQTALEAHACATPVVAFAGTGVEDVVDHLITGYMAQKLVPEDLAAGIKWVIDEIGRSRELGERGRIKFESNFSSDVIAASYIETYKRLLRDGPSEGGAGRPAPRVFRSGSIRKSPGVEAGIEMSS